MYTVSGSVTRNPFVSGNDRPLRADQQAQVAADASFPVQNRPAVFIHPDGLVSAVPAGNSAPAAADTAFHNKLRKDHSIPFECLGVFIQYIQSKARRFPNTGKSLFRPDLL